MPNLTAKQIRQELKKSASAKKAKILQGFFKTGPGEYGAGDIFIGVTVPEIRNIVKKFSDISIKETILLLKSKIHEERLTAVLILVTKFKTSETKDKKIIFDLYFKNIKHINNWDLIDLSAEHIVGGFLADRNRSLLWDLSRSKNLWERRIAVVATFYFIRRNIFDPTLRLGRMLLNDKEDLIHKALGWMLREVGKRDENLLKEEFLRRYYRVMPRTMLRYTIERFPKKERLAYLKGKV